MGSVVCASLYEYDSSSVLTEHEAKTPNLLYKGVQEGIRAVSHGQWLQAPVRVSVAHGDAGNLDQMWLINASDVGSELTFWRGWNYSQRDVRKPSAEEENTGKVAKASEAALEHLIQGRGLFQNWGNGSHVFIKIQVQDESRVGVRW